MNLVITKRKLSGIHAKLEGQLQRNERIFQEVVRLWFAFVIKQIQADLRAKYIKKDITSELTDWERLNTQSGIIIKPAVLRIMENGGNTAYKTLKVQGTFDVLNVEAVREVERICAKLVREVNEETKNGIRTYIRRGIEGGKSMNKIARELRPLVGLTENQTQSVINYRTLLSDEEKFPGLTLTDIDRKVARYADKTHRLRTENIAQTETARAQNVGYVEGLEELGIRETELSAAPGCCEECDSLNGRRYRVDEARNVIPVHPRCFADAQTPIFTSKGWKSISKICVDDLVLTHRKRFRKVTQIMRIPKQSPQMIAIYLSDKRGNYTTLTVTEDHPVLLNDKWMIAKEVTVGMHVSYMASKCRRCEKPIPFNRVYCSGRCCSLDTTDKQWSSDEHRQLISKKVSTSMKQQYASGARDGKKTSEVFHFIGRQMIKEGKHPWQHQSPELWKKIRLVTNLPKHRLAQSERMKKNNPSHNPTARYKATESLKKTLLLHPEKRLNARMGKFRKSGNMTWIESRMDQLLSRLGIDYVFQYPILNYDVDFAIPALRIAIECDGEHWHLNKQKDLERQEQIEKEGWFVLRYTGQKINQCLDEIEGELKRILMNHNKQYDFLDMKIVKVLRWQPKKRKTLYNFSVDEDESYIAKGFVVHNCRCAMLPVVK